MDDGWMFADREVRPITQRPHNPDCTLLIKRVCVNMNEIKCAVYSGVKQYINTRRPQCLPVNKYTPSFKSLGHKVKSLLLIKAAFIKTAISWNIITV